MFVKKFEAPTFDKAISLVKQELGTEALILSTQQRRSHWLGKESYEVTAAYPKTAGETKPDPPKNTELEEKLRGVFPHRKFEFRSDSPAPRSGNVPSPGRYQKYESHFRQAGFLPATAREMSRQLVVEFSERDLAVPRFLERVTLDRLCASLQTESPAIFDRIQRWEFVGGPGSGRTSLMVKLALQLKQMGHRVSLAAAEDRKLFGRAELAQYAKLIGVPLAPHPKARVVLQDGPVLPLRRQRLDPEWTRVIVIDATSRLREMERVLEWSASLRPKAVAFTKLDVAGQLGVIFEFLKRCQLPVLGASVSHSFRTPFQFYKEEALAKRMIRGEA